jgi:hypothetical protein
MSITKEDANKFKDKVEEFVHAYIPNQPVNFLAALYNYASQQSKSFIPLKYELAATHGTGIKDTELDYNMLMLSIISICWAVRMRKVKSEEGQCHAHITNCNETRILHKDIYNQWINLVDEALRVLRLDPPLT